MDLKELKAAIFKIETRADLEEIQRVVRLKADALRELMALEYKVGDKITWEHNGTTYHGKITKINRKTFSAESHTPTFGRWKIGIGLCTRAE